MYIRRDIWNDIKMMVDIDLETGRKIKFGELIKGNRFWRDKHPMHKIEEMVNSPQNCCFPFLFNRLLTR